MQQPMERQQGARTMAHICFNHLTKRYGPIVAVDDFTVTLQPGKITGFLGPNGAGKSTTLRMLVGLTTPSGGTATIDGLPYPKLSHPSRAIGAVTDSAVFHPRRSGRDALRVLCALGGIPSRRADEVIDLVELTAPVDGTSAATRWACGSDWPWPPRCWATPRPWCSTS